MSNIDLIGQVFGFLTVKSRQGFEGYRVWECLCNSPAHDIPKVTYASTDVLRSGKKVSCGCKKSLKKDPTSHDEIYRLGRLKNSAQESRYEVYGTIKDFLKNTRNHTLLTTFAQFLEMKNHHLEPLQIACEFGHSYSQKWSTLQKASGHWKSSCRECYVLDYLTKRGWKFVKIDSDTEMVTAICAGDHEVTHMSVKFFQPSGKCQRCIRGEPTKSKQSTINLILARGYTPPAEMPEKLYHLTKFTVLCAKGHPYLTSRYNLVHGMRCPQCIESRVISDAELEIREWLKSKGLEFIPNHKIGVTAFRKGMEMDLFLPTENLAIEHHGCYYHSDLKIRNISLHLYKFLKTKKLGIHLFQVFEDEWKQQKEMVKRTLLKLLHRTPVFSGTLTPKRISVAEGIEFSKANNLWVPRAMMGIGFYDQNKKIQACLFLTSTGTAEIMVEWVESLDFTFSDVQFQECLKMIPTGAKLEMDNRVPSFHDLKTLGFSISGYLEPKYWYVKGAARQMEPATERKIYDARSTLWVK
jgi:hypothetical protein